jgi:hypothetical protein
MKSFPVPASRLAPALTGLVVAWLVTGSGSSRVAMRSEARHATAPSSESEAFHLGTAAGPFGWSSAVADFDHDGEPDFTVADRLGGTAGGGYSYRIVFSVAGRATQTVSFESPVAALTLAVQDIDHDNDLDVLVTEAPSRMVNAVWLNDGHGRFVESPIRPPSSSLVDEGTLTSPADVLSAFLLAPDRGVAKQVRRSAAEPLPSRGAALARRDSQTPSVVAASTSCRAPPSPPRASLA